MGSEAYIWVTRYQENLSDALDTARKEVFAAGKFAGAERNPESIEEAWMLDPMSGTGSLLDIFSVSDTPELCSVNALSAEELTRFFGTERPTLEEIRENGPFWESVERGEARAIVLYNNGTAEKICFAGMTIDAPAVGNGSREDADPGKLEKLRKQSAGKARKSAARVIPEEERAADMEFIKDVLGKSTILPGTGSDSPTPREFSPELVRFCSVFDKYADDLDFLLELMTTQPELMEKFHKLVCEEESEGPDFPKSGFSATREDGKNDK